MFAHAAPAAPPLFDSNGCVTVIDLDQQQKLELTYAVAMDDAELTAGDIPLPDALTHQFFAFRGTFTLEGFKPLFHLLAPDTERFAVPIWITWADVQRAAKSSSEHFLGYEFSEATKDVVLESTAAFEHLWLRITADDARVPITRAQSFRPVTWDLSQVDPGIYSVAGYIFSPPYNGWEIRPGLIKLTRKGVNAPAAVLDRVQETLFGAQGRRVGACVDVPEGTRMRAFVLYQDRGDAGWVPWTESQPVSTGRVDLCFHNPMPAQAGTVRLRLDLTDPSGETTSFHTPDTITLLSGTQACTESATVCCHAAAPDPGGAVAGGAAVMPGELMEKARAGGACSLTHLRAEPSGWVWIWVVSAGLWWRRRAARRGTV